MKKWSILALMLALVVALLAGCGEADPEKIAARTVAEVNGVKITRGEAQKVYDFLMPQTVMMYAEQGMEVDATNSSTIASVKSTTLGIITEGVALEQKLEALGNGITEEDRERIRTEAKEEYEQTVQAYVVNAGITEEESRAAIDGMGYTEYAIEYMRLREEIETRLLPFAAADVVITDEDVHAKYDELVASAQAAYEETPSQFINDVMGGATLYAQPEGFRYIKNLVISFPEDVDALISEKDSEYYTLMMEQYQTQVDMGVEGIEEEKKAELEAKLAEYEAEFSRLQTEVEALEVTGLEKLLPDAEEILAKVQAPDADFDALIEEYSADQPTGVMKEKGYPVNAGATNYVASFTEAAMALQNVGDVSGLVASEYGYHILQYASDVTAGPIPYDDLKDEVSALLLTEKQDEALYAKMTEWLDAAKIKTQINNF